MARPRGATSRPRDPRYLTPPEENHPFHPSMKELPHTPVSMSDREKQDLLEAVEERYGSG